MIDIKKLAKFCFENSSQWMQVMSVEDIEKFFSTPSTKYEYIEEDKKIIALIIYQTCKKDAHAYYCGSKGGYSILKKLAKKIASKENIDRLSWINPNWEFKVLEV